MGNQLSYSDEGDDFHPETPQQIPKSFPGSALLDGTAMLCGVDTTTGDSLLKQADRMCVSSPSKDEDDDIRLEQNDFRAAAETTTNPTSALFARALVSEVTDNPNTMTPAKMAEREKKLLKAQDAAKKSSGKQGRPNKNGSKAVGAPGGVGQPSLLGSLAHALGGSATVQPDEDANRSTARKTVEPPSSMQENRAQVGAAQKAVKTSKHRITVGLSLSRRHSTVGHPDTVTRQTAFDFNELQDREYKYVSSTDATGWRAGGGERGGTSVQPAPSPIGFDEEADYYQQSKPATPAQTHKVAAPDTVHIPIIHIDAESPEAVDRIIAALARGEVFIPHMAVLPEALSVNGISPPDLVVRFGTERNDDQEPDEWPNWCLEFMHNQLYEYFAPMGARWMKRPFQIELAKKVRWKTVKHMNRYFAHAERVLDAWREKGPQHLDPQLSYIEGGATPEEVARPHGIYLLRNGVATNYFAPNFDPPYTTKMTRSLLTNVLDKSWDKKRREWTSEPVPRLVTPASLLTNLCGCGPGENGFMANEVTSPADLEDTIVDTVVTLDDDSKIDPDPSVVTSFHPPTSKEQQRALIASTQLSPIPQEVQSPATPAARRSPVTARMSPVAARVSPSTIPQPRAPAFQLHPIDTSQEMLHGENYFQTPIPEDRYTQQQQEQQNSPEDKYVLSPTLSDTNSRNSKGRPRPPTPEQPRAGDAASEVAMSAATVPHINTASALLRTDPATLQTSDSQKRRFKTKQEKDANTVREIAKVALLQENPSPRPAAAVENAFRDPKRMELAQAVADYEEKKSDASPRFAMGTISSDSHSVQRSDSNISLEYSMDSSMLGGGESSITGNYFSENSVATNGSRSRKTPKSKKNMSPLPRTNEDDSVGFDALSVGTGGTNGSEIPAPTDQELFAVGWAKALDPKSGSYYYFTLDRSKIIWDNPLIERSVFSGSTTSDHR